LVCHTKGRTQTEDFENRVLRRILHLRGRKWREMTS